MEKTPREISEVGLFMFKERYEHLASVKKQQWIIANYVALIYAAIFGISHLYSEHHVINLYQLLLLKGLALCACGIGLLHLFTNEKNMMDTRAEIAKSIEWIFGDYNKGASTERAHIVGPDDATALCRDLPFLLAFIMVVIGGAALVCVFI